MQPDGGCSLYELLIFRKKPETKTLWSFQIQTVYCDVFYWMLIASFKSLGPHWRTLRQHCLLGFTFWSTHLIKLKKGNKYFTDYHYNSCSGGMNMPFICSAYSPSQRVYLTKSSRQMISYRLDAIRQTDVMKYCDHHLLRFSWCHRQSEMEAGRRRRVTCSLNCFCNLIQVVRCNPLCPCYWVIFSDAVHQRLCGDYSTLPQKKLKTIRYVVHGSGFRSSTAWL